MNEYDMLVCLLCIALGAAVLLYRLMVHNNKHLPTDSNNGIRRLIRNYIRLLFLKIQRRRRKDDYYAYELHSNLK